MIRTIGDHVFHLATQESSYVIEIAGGVVPALRYWGRRLDADPSAGAVGAAGAGSDDGRRLAESRADAPYRINAGKRLQRLQLEGLRLEYGVHGSWEFRRPALYAFDAEGYPMPELVYRSSTAATSWPR